MFLKTFTDETLFPPYFRENWLTCFKKTFVNYQVFLQIGFSACDRLKSSPLIVGNFFSQKKVVFSKAT